MVSAEVRLSSSNSCEVWLSVSSPAGRPRQEQITEKPCAWSERVLNSDGFAYGITVGAFKETTVLNAGPTLAVTGSARQILKTLGTHCLWKSVRSRRIQRGLMLYR
jgi:hypothetical protein